MERLPDGTTTYKRSPGGLVTALEPLLRRRRGAWVGWPGITDGDEEPIFEDDLEMRPVRLSADDVADYYEGFSNATLWPLYHDVIVKPIYHREWWDRYVDVNRRFAEATASAAAEGATVWIQDYQLQLVPKMLRDAAARPRHRFLPAHPVPARRAVHADAVAHRDRRRASRRRSRRLPPAGRRAELPHPGRRLIGANTSRATRRRAVAIRRDPGRLPHRQGRRLPHLDRLRRTRHQGPQPSDPAAREGDSRRARQPAQDAARRRPARLHQGHRRSTARPSRSCSTRAGPIRRTPCWSSWRRQAANASRATR